MRPLHPPPLCKILKSVTADRYHLLPPYAPDHHGVGTHPFLWQAFAVSTLGQALRQVHSCEPKWTQAALYGAPSLLRGPCQSSKLLNYRRKNGKSNHHSRCLYTANYGPGTVVH